MDDEKLEREAAKIIFSTPAKAEEPIARAEPEGPEVAFVCPFCNETYQVSEELAGKSIKCRNCREASPVDARKRIARRGPPHRFHWLSFWLGVAASAVAMALAVLIMKMARLL